MKLQNKIPKQDNKIINLKVSTYVWASQLNIHTLLENRNSKKRKGQEEIAKSILF